MNCQNCGASVIGEFCAECGTKVVHAPIDSPAAQASKAPSSAIRKIVIGVLALATAGLAAFGITQQTQVNTATAAVVNATNKISEFQASADSWYDLLQSAQSSKTTCYYAWWCSPSTYATWISLVNSDQGFYDDAIASVDSWKGKLYAAQKEKSSAESNRTIGFAGAGVSAVGLVVYLIATRRKPQTQVVAAE